MKRREILRYTALLTGAAVTVPVASSLFSSCQNLSRESMAGEGLYFFSSQEFDFITGLVDIILPRTESPSATDVGVHHTIDSMVGLVYTEQNRDAYRANLAPLMDYLEKNTTDKKAAIIHIEKENPDDLRSAYLHIKQQTIAYYLSTEEIGKNYLNYLPIPGEYLPCISLEEAGGKAWAI